MTNEQAKNLVMKVFDSIKEAKDIGDIEMVKENNELTKIPDLKKYPRIDFTITRAEVEKLSLKPTTPLEKLLYSALWKNGQLKRINSLIEGIRSVKNEAPNEDRIVYYQFGKHLTGDKSEPIIDQHTLRAFEIYQSEESDITRIRRKSNYTKTDWPLVKCYKEWLTANINENIRNTDDYPFVVDQIIFALGKQVKLKRMQ